MKVNNKYLFSLLITSLFLLVSCGSDSKETNSKAVVEEYEKSIRDTFLEGKIIGDVNGKAFSFYNEEEGPGKIRESNTGKHLNLTFSTLPTLMLTINIPAYKGADTYVGGSKFLVLTFKNPRAKFKNSDDSKLTIIEDNDTNLKGSLSLTTVSESSEKFVINAEFDLTKVVIDLNDQEALLKIIKDKPSIIESLGNLSSDKEFILKAIPINQIAFKYADKSLKGDGDFILKAMQENPKSLLLMHANKEIKSDRSFALKAIKVNGNAFYLLDGKLKKDKDFALKALKINPKVFNFLGKTLKMDADIIAASKRK